MQRHSYALGEHCRGVAHSFCTAVKRLSEPKKHCQYCLMSTTLLLHGPWSQSVAHSLACDISGNVPLLQTSRYITARDKFYQTFPALALRVKYSGEKRPGHDADPCIRGFQHYQSHLVDVDLQYHVSHKTCYFIWSNVCNNYLQGLSI